MHSGKGLEFSLVFISNMEEKFFPQLILIEEPDKFEEERRLAHIGNTRVVKSYTPFTPRKHLYGK
jgi:DNA helicase-2/ATP-dependent DNA helicase PcrA